MFTEEALAQSVRPAVLNRGRAVARRGYVTRRLCHYTDALTELSASVESSTDREGYYRVSLTVDETSDSIVKYACDCPAAYKFAGPCKHVVALGIDFLENPARYQGFDEFQHVSTTPILASMLDRMQRVENQTQAAQVEQAGAVRLEPTLTYAPARDDLCVRFRILGSQGGYVVKHIGDLVDDVRSAAVVTYGKKLTVLHEEASFDPLSWQIVQWLSTCVQNRRSFSSQRYYGGYYGGNSSWSGSASRDMRLSGPEADELIELLMGHELSFELEGNRFAGVTLGGNAAQVLTVVEEDPSIGVELRPAEGGAFELVRTESAPLREDDQDASVQQANPRGESRAARMRRRQAADDRLRRFWFFSTERYAYALQRGKLMRCSQRLFELRDFIRDVYCGFEDKLLVSAEDAPRFAAYLLPLLESELGVVAPPELEALKPVPCTLSFYLDSIDGLVTAEAVGAYGEQSWRLRPAGVEAARDPRRDAKAEAAARQLLSRYFVQVKPLRGPAVPNDDPQPSWQIPAKDVDAVARLVFGGVGRLRELGSVYTTPSFDRLVSTARPQVRMGVSVESNLIRLEVSADDLPLADLHALLASYRRKRSYHRLRDGSLLDLAGLDLDEAALLADELGLTARQLAAGVVDLPSYKAFLLDGMLTDEEKDDSFYQWIDDFRNVDLAAYEPPKPLSEKLRAYQVQGFQWLSALADMGFGGILADEMGLGKTAQIIAFLLSRRGRGRSLVVCPASLVYNWQAEFEKFAPALDVAVVAGTAAQRRAVRAEKGHEVLVTSYDLLRRDIESYAQEEFFCVVLDEAQYVKNHQTLAARAVKSLEARHRFALTGTPVENRLSELWSIFDFLMPGLLGGYERFRERYETEIVAGNDEVADRLRAAVGPFILRRLKRDVLTDLPDKLESTVVARMGKEQGKLYHAHEQALRLSITSKGKAEFGSSKLQILAELTRLRQLCCDPSLVYDDYKGGSCKLDAIWELVSSSVDAGAKVLVFSQFTSFLALIAARLRKEHVAFFELTGSTPKERRLQMVDQFNGDDTPAFLISLKAGGTGLNLTGAQVVIHADPWWNVAAEDQATDRAHRIGQTSDVAVYKVICRDTIEERILALQEAKANLADAVVGEGDGLRLGSLAKEELLELLG